MHCVLKTISGRAPQFAAFLQVHEQQGDGCRRHSRYSRRLAHRGGSCGAELLPNLTRKPGYRAVIQVFRQRRIAVALMALDLLLLAADIPGVLGLDLDLGCDLVTHPFIEPAELALADGAQRGQATVIDLRSPQNLFSTLYTPQRKA